MGKLPWIACGAVSLLLLALTACAKGARGGAKVSLSPAEAEWLKSHREWRVVGSHSPPFQWIDEGGGYRGLGADYDRLISGRLGTSVRAVGAPSWADSLQQLLSGECDACTMMIYTPDRAKNLNFTKELVELPTVAMVRNDFPGRIAKPSGLNGRKVAVARSWAIQERVEHDYPGMRIVPFDDVRDALMAVSNGSVEAYVGDLASASYGIQELGLTNLKVAIMMPYSYSLRIGVRKDWPELVSILDKAIDSISEKERREIGERWMAVRVDGWTLREVLMVGVPSVLVLVLAMLAVHVVDMGREVRLRRAAEDAVLETQGATIVALAALAETRDSDTGAHLERTRKYVGLLAEELRRRGWGNLGALEVELLSKTAPLHDVGKVGIPDHILKKPGKFTPEEFAVMQTHTTLGAEALSKAGKGCRGGGLFLRLASEIALSHHEKWDGSGYPQGLRGEQIPVGGRIMAVADVYDALRSRRVYKGAMSHAETVEMICREGGKAFDPAVLEAFRAVAPEFEKIAKAAGDLPEG